MSNTTIWQRPGQAATARANECGADWSQPTADDLKLDPHLFWAEQTCFAGYAREPDGRVRVAFELDTDSKVNAAQRAALLDLHHAESGVPAAMRRIDIPALHLDRLALAGTRFFTALCRLDSLRSVIAPKVKRLKPGFVGGGRGWHAEGSSAAGGGAEAIDWKKVARQIEQKRFDALREALEARHESLPPVDPCAGAPARKAAPRRASRPSSEVIVGIIDFGCAFAHPHFAQRRADGSLNSRVRHFWDQGRTAAWSGTPADLAWQSNVEAGYGRELDWRELNRLLAGKLPGQAPQVASAQVAVGQRAADYEHWCYALAGLPELLRPDSHGTQVMDAAAGRGFRAVDGTPRDDDAASRADIVFVQLPQQAVQDLSGAWLVVHVIDAIEYILRRARATDKRRRVVINLSYGNFAGSHDGHSLLEAALDLYASLGVVVVLAAGNAPPSERPIHASARIAAGGEATLQWMLQPADATQSFLELWFKGPMDQAIVEITTPPPDSQAVRLDRNGRAACLTDANDLRAPAMAGAWFVQGSRAGGHDGMALIACAPTDVSRAAAGWSRPAEAGPWTVRIRRATPAGETGNMAPADLHVSAWVERDDPGTADAPVSTQSWLRLPAGQAGFSAGRPNENANTALSQGRHTLTVGAVTVGGDGSCKMFDESAFGADRLRPQAKTPTLAGPGERALGRERRGIVAAANTGFGESEVRGTSIAAAWATRCALNAMAGQPGLDSKGSLLKLWGANSAHATDTAGFGLLVDAQAPTSAAAVPARGAAARHRPRRSPP